MKTHPSSESPNAAPDKSHQATEKTQTCISKGFNCFSSQVRRKVQHSQDSTLCISAINMHPQGQARVIYANQSLQRCWKYSGESSVMEHHSSRKLEFGVAETSVEVKPVWFSPPWGLSVILASYPPHSPWIAALTSAVLLWLRKQGRERKNSSYKSHKVTTARLIHSSTDIIGRS